MVSDCVKIFVGRNLDSFECVGRDLENFWCVGKCYGFGENVKV